MAKLVEMISVSLTENQNLALEKAAQVLSDDKVGTLARKYIIQGLLKDGFLKEADQSDE